VAIFFAMPGNERLAGDLARLTQGRVGNIDVRRFPDGETYVRIVSEVRARQVFIVCTLAEPDSKLLPLAFAASTIRDRGAARVELIAPYLAYMRQDRIFHPGEALTSRFFAEMLQPKFDALLTVDPHLHRRASLDEIYDIPATVVHAAPLLAQWVATHAGTGFIVGPDAESAQWVEAIARDAGVPWTIFSKVRRGDRKISLRAPDLSAFRGRVPILVDDIIASGATLRQAARILSREGFPPACCLVVHALCAAQTARAIRARSAAFVTSNSVPNADSGFDVAALIAGALQANAAVDRGTDVVAPGGATCPIQGPLPAPQPSEANRA
jgi:ribose-phosphate pyrophosphokinase